MFQDGKLAHNFTTVREAEVSFNVEEVNEDRDITFVRVTFNFDLGWLPPVPQPEAEMYCFKLVGDEMRYQPETSGDFLLIVQASNLGAYEHVFLENCLRMLRDLRAKEDSITSADALFFPYRGIINFSFEMPDGLKLDLDRLLRQLAKKFEVIYVPTRLVQMIEEDLLMDDED